MSCDAEFTRRYELIQSGLAVVSELEERTETEGSPRLEEIRSCLFRAGKEIGTPEFDRRFSKAMGLASSIAVSHGYDSLAEDALKLGPYESWIECSTVEKQEENIYRACELVVDEPFGDASSPDELVQRTESVLHELNCEVRTDFAETSQLFFVDVAESDCAGVVEIVLDELEWYTSFWYRESMYESEEYEESYVGEFIRDVAPTTEGENV
jgi:hypothetical protein